jgi:2-polyprenyl-3-methyl-5-hydroxy-6-metoxy-1,4-benzoquinol methylase
MGKHKLRKPEELLTKSNITPIWICDPVEEQKKMTQQADIQKRRAAEAEFWGNCYDMNALGEIVKQTTYAYEMGIFDEYGDKDCDIDLDGASVIDIGSGPWSLLLRCYNTGKLTAVDPIPWPPSVARRYATYGIEFVNKGGEEIGNLLLADEVWIYNCLQHVEDPILVLANAKKIGRRIRIFEWLNTAKDTYHLHTLTAELLMQWLEGTTTERVRTIELTGRCLGTAFVGSFIANPPVKPHTPKLQKPITGPILGKSDFSGQY